MSPTVRTRRLGRWFPWVVVALLTAGSVAFLIAYQWSGTRRPKSTGVTRQVPLERSGRRVAVSFILNALGRKHLEEAWALATASERGGLTKRQWMTGETPILPLEAPIAKVEITKVFYSGPTTATLNILVVPRVPNRLRVKEALYVMDLKNLDSRWLVDYCQPTTSHSVPAPV